MTRQPWSTARFATVNAVVIGFSLLLIGIVAGSASALGTATVTGSGWADPTMPTSLDAQEACQGFILNYLKAPMSAVFSEGETSHTGYDWLAFGAVDSQNGFGVMLRNSYLCTMTFDPDTGSFSVDEHLLG